MDYDDGNVFARIIRKEIPADIVHEDDHCLAFRDINAQAPVHVLIIPKDPLARLADEAICIGPAEPSRSYLHTPAIIAAMPAAANAPAAPTSRATCGLV